jgi:hypothetical protein
MRPEYYVYLNYTDYYNSCSSFSQGLLITYRYMYNLLFFAVKPVFNTIPFYYQAMLVCLFIFIFRFFKDKNLYKNSSLKWLFIVFKNFISKCTNYKIFFSYFFNKINFFITFISFKVFHHCRYFLSVVVDLLKKHNPFVLWRPVFKKTSYFGIFSGMRSKWFKNKK